MMTNMSSTRIIDGGIETENDKQDFVINSDENNIEFK